MTTDTQATPGASPLFANVGGKMVDVRVFPIPLRPDCTVRVFGIPHDMTKAEAEKIGRVLRALAPDDAEGGSR